MSFFELFKLEKDKKKKRNSVCILKCKKEENVQDLPVAKNGGF